MKHFECKSCGNLVSTLNYSGKPISCCSAVMREVVPKVEGEGSEKHTPTVKVKDGVATVSIGTEGNMHPMDSDHRISWICLVTNDGTYRKLLPPTKYAVARFHLEDNEHVIRAFAFCNKHGTLVCNCESREACESGECGKGKERR